VWKAIVAAGIERSILPWHDLRHTALTHDAAVGNPAVYVHAAKVAFPGAAERAEDRVFAAVSSTES
jgi:hypothetical protein